MISWQNTNMVVSPELNLRYIRDVFCENRGVIQTLSSSHSRIFFYFFFASNFSSFPFNSFDFERPKSKRKRRKITEREEISYIILANSSFGGESRNLELGVALVDEIDTQSPPPPPRTFVVPTEPPPFFLFFWNSVCLQKTSLHRFSGRHSSQFGATSIAMHSTSDTKFYWFNSFAISLSSGCDTAASTTT